MTAAKRHPFDGAELTCAEIAARTGVNIESVRRYVRRGARSAADLQAQAAEGRRRMWEGARRGGKAARYSSLLPGEARP